MSYYERNPNSLVDFLNFNGVLAFLSKKNPQSRNFACGIPHQLVDVIVISNTAAARMLSPKFNILRSLPLLLAQPVEDIVRANAKNHQRLTSFRSLPKLTVSLIR
jgi:hypothetical protein